MKSYCISTYLCIPAFKARITNELVWEWMGKRERKKPGDVNGKFINFMSTSGALTLKGQGGGRNPPPSTFRAIISRNFLFRAASFHDFFLSSFAQLLALFSEKSGVRFQSHATLCNQTSAQNLKIFWICVQNMENGFLCQNSILSSKMQYLLSLQLKSLLYLLIFNTQTIPYKKQ